MIRIYWNGGEKPFVPKCCDYVFVLPAKHCCVELPQSLELPLQPGPQLAGGSELTWRFERVRTATSNRTSPVSWEGMGGTENVLTNGEKTSERATILPSLPATVQVIPDFLAFFILGLSLTSVSQFGQETRWQPAY